MPSAKHVDHVYDGVDAQIGGVSLFNRYAHSAELRKEASSLLSCLRRV